MKIETHDKFYVIINDGGSKQQVRRDIYWDSGWKDPKEIEKVEKIENAINLLESV